MCCSTIAGRHASSTGINADRMLGFVVQAFMQLLLERQILKCEIPFEIAIELYAHLIE